MVFCLSNFMTFFILCNIISMRSKQRNFPFKIKFGIYYGETYFRSIIYGILLANCQIERYHAPRSIRRRSQRWWGERGRCLDSCSFMTYDWARIHSTDRTEPSIIIIIIFLVALFHNESYATCLSIWQLFTNWMIF